MKRQRRGNGSITETKAGKFRVRAPDAKRSHLGTYTTHGEASAVLEAARRTLAIVGPLGAAVTLEEFAAKVLDERELEGYRGTDGERRYYKKHILGSVIGRLPITAIDARSIREFVKVLGRSPASDRRVARTLSHHTVKRCLTILSAVFAAAVERGIIESNPVIGVKVKRPANLAATRDAWTWLTPSEQRAFEAGPIPEDERLIVLFAMGTGLRQGEQWNLELRDLHTEDDAQGGPHLIVRFGSKGKPPKNGKIRRVPLFGVALAAARRWLELLPTFVRGEHATTRNEAGLVFPGRRGSRRQCGKFNRHEGLRNLLKACGIDRPVRWHDLRHTCASSLVSGVWGRTWSLHEVCAMLGHSSVTVTERYAHVGEDFLTRAASETGRLAVSAAAVVSLPDPAMPSSRGPSGHSSPEPTSPDLSISRGFLSPFSDLNRRPALYESRSKSLSFPASSTTEAPHAGVHSGHVLDLFDRTPNPLEKPAPFFVTWEAVRR